MFQPANKCQFTPYFVETARYIHRSNTLRGGQPNFVGAFHAPLSSERKRTLLQPEKSSFPQIMNTELPIHL